MAVKRLLGMVVPVVFLASGALAQVNEVSATFGRTFVSTQSILNTNSPDPKIHFSREETVAFDYSLFLKRYGIFGLRVEVPLAIYPRIDLNTYQNVIPADYGALFVTPSVRVNIFSGDSLTPWVSAGGGYGRFRYAPRLNYFGPNPGAGGSNTGVVQFGAGLDAWIFHNWGARFELRDFYSGAPDFNVDTGRSRQHNYYVGAGVLYRF